MHSVDELQRMALSMGATLEIDGEIFNAAGIKADAAPPPAPVPPVVVIEPPPPPVTAGLTREEVESMLLARDEQWRQQVATLSQMLTAALQSQKPADEWDMDVQYGHGATITKIKLKAIR